MGGSAAFHFGDLFIRPLIQLVGKGPMLRVKKWQAQMRGPAHDGSPH
jgi:hypothetical protein